VVVVDLEVVEEEELVGVPVAVSVAGLELVVALEVEVEVEVEEEEVVDLVVELVVGSVVVLLVEDLEVDGLKKRSYLFQMYYLLLLLNHSFNGAYVKTIS
jgi:phosphatidylserine synthase